MARATTGSTGTWAAISFTDVTDAIGIQDYHADSFTAIFADFTGDGLPDIYQANDHRPDRFYENIGGGQFRELRLCRGLTRSGNCMGVATTVGDDGMPAPLHHQHHRPRPAYFGTNLGNTFMMATRTPQAGSNFSDAAAGAGVLDTAWGWGTVVVDMNVDGAPDLYAVQGMRQFVGDGSVHLANATSHLFLDDGSGRYVTPWPRAPAATCRATSAPWWSSTTTATARPTCSSPR